MDTNTCLVVALIVIVVVVAVVWFRRRSAASAAKEMTQSASNMASSATGAVKDTASSAASMTKDAAASAGGAATAAAAGAASAAAGAGSAAVGAAGAAAAAAGGAMGLDQMSSMLNGILDGSSQMDANSPLGQMVTPMADEITGKLGLPKGVGAMIVTYGLAMITKWMQAKSAGTGTAPMEGGMNADEVLGKLSSGGGLDAGSLQSMGLTSELAKKTGLGEAQASQGLEMAMGMLSAGMSGQKSYQGMNLPDMSLLTNMMK